MDDRLSSVCGAIVSQFGAGSAGSATSQLRGRPRVSTGSFGLDLAFGGGLPIGTASLIWGDRGSGKTTTAIRIAGRLQQICRRCLRQTVLPIKSIPPEIEGGRWVGQGVCDCIRAGAAPMPPTPPQISKEKSKDYKDRVGLWEEQLKKNSYSEFVVAWIDPEQAFDPEWAEQLGADPRRIFYAQPATAEEASDMAKAVSMSGGADLLVIDSLAQFTPSEEIKVSTTEWQQGLAARITNKGVRTWIAGAVQTRRLNIEQGVRWGLTQIWTNQQRLKIGISYGDPSVKPGGMGQEFANKIELRFLPSKILYDEQQYGGKEDKLKTPIKQIIKFKVLKNNTASMNGFLGEYMMACRDDPDGRYKAGDVLDGSLIEKLVFHFLVEEPKKGTYIFAGEEFKTKKAVMDRVADPEVKGSVIKILTERIVGKRQK